MKPLAIVGAVAGGAVGAAVWAVIAWKLDMEIGYVAWGIGFLVGFVAVLCGGSGKVNGVMCAIVALLSIFGGKVAAAMAIAPEVMRQELAKEGVPEDQRAAFEKEFLGKLQFSDYVDMAKDTLGPIDIVFGLLGIATAFKIGSTDKDQESKTTVDPSRPVNLSGPGAAPAAPPSASPPGPSPAFGDPPEGPPPAVHTEPAPPPPVPPE